MVTFSASQKPRQPIVLMIFSRILSHGFRVAAALAVLFFAGTQSSFAQFGIAVTGNQVLCQGESLQLTATVTDSSQVCDYYLEMDDTFGDGWNGAQFTLTINGVSTDYTFGTGFSDSVYIQVTNGDVLEVSFTSGGFANEESYIFYDAMGNIVAQDGPFPVNGPVWNGVADCGSGNPLTVQWSPTTGVSDPASLTPTLNPTTTTTYTVDVLDSTSTIVTSTSVTVVVAPNFTVATTASPDALCLNGSTSLSAVVTGGGTYSYDWNLANLLDDATLANPTASFGSFGNFDFEVEITSDSGCVHNSTVPVFVSGSVPSVISAEDDTTCVGVPVDLSVDIEAIAPASCNYDLQLINFNGFGWQGDSLRIWVNGTLLQTVTLATGLASVVNLTFTDGDVVELEYQQQPFSFGNVYQLSDADGNVLFVDNAPVTGIAYTFTADCGLSYDGWQYTWTPATGLNTTTGTDVTATLTSNQTYTIYAADTVCGYYDTTTVTAYAVPSYGNTVTPGDTGYCLGAVVQLGITHDTTGAFTYTWNNAGVLDDATSATPTATLNNPGLYAFEVLIESPWGCDILETFEIGISPNPTPNVTVLGGPGVCDGESVTLTASTGPADGDECFMLLDMEDTFGDGWNGAEFVFYVNGVSTTHTVQNGTGQLDTLWVSQGDSIWIEFTSGQYPNEEFYTLYDSEYNVIFADGDTPDEGLVWTGYATCGTNTSVVYLYDWQPNVWLDDNSIESPSVSLMSDTTYTVTVTDSIGGCSGTATIDLFVAHFTPVQVLQIPDTFCSGDLQSMQLFADVAGGVWSGTGLTDDSLGIWVPEAAGAGSHTLTYTLNDFGSCVSSDATTIEVLQSPNSPIIDPLVACEGEDVILDATTQVGDLLWYTDAQLTDFVGTGSMLNVGPLSGSGQYWVVASNGDCNSAPAALPYDIEAPASTGSINGNDPVNEWSTGIYNVPQTLGSSYTWAVTGGTISSGQGSNFVSIAWGDGAMGQLAVVETTGGGCVGDTVYFDVTINATGIASVAGNNAFQVWPNPTSDVVNVQRVGDESGAYSIAVLDVAGRVVYTGERTSDAVMQLPLGQLPNGVYVLTVTGAEVHQQRLVIQH